MGARPCLSPRWGLSRLLGSIQGRARVRFAHTLPLATFWPRLWRYWKLFLKENRSAGKIAGDKKERALTSPKTSALAFISVLPWRINDGEILAAPRLM